jgi:ATP-binding cassette subfamily C protein CydC
MAVMPNWSKHKGMGMPVMTNRRERIGNFGKLMVQIKPYTVGLVMTVISGVLRHSSTIGAAALTAYITGLAMEGMFLSKAKTLVILTMICIAVRVATYYAEMYIAHDVAFKILADFRISLFNALERVSPAILLNMRSGQLAATLMSDVEILEWFFAHTFGNIIVTIVVPLFILIYIGSFHLSLLLIMLIYLFIIVSIPFLMKKKADTQGKEVREKLAEGNAVTIEGIHGLKEILTLNYKEAYKEKNLRYMDRLSESQLAYGKRLGTEGGLIQAFVGLAMISVMITAIFLISQNKLAFAYFPVIVMLSAMTFNPIVEISNMARNFGLILAASDRVYRVLEAKPLVEDTGTAIDTSELNPEIEFDNVSFRYREDLPDAVSDVSFHIQAGEAVALVGPSGAGKSTCIQLLMRHWDPRSGQVKIGGKNIKEISLNNMREMTTAVLQDVYLFNDSIEENIRLGKIDATHEEVVKAAKASLAHEFIMNTEEGYATFPGERGNQLSGGEKQRIAIARAILKDSPILILDEAVSNLDSENEFSIQKALKKLRQGKTTVIVAHRVSTIMSADRVIVLNKGRVMQTGKHDELIQQDGFYKDIIQMQQF